MMATLGTGLAFVSRGLANDGYAAGDPGDSEYLNMWTAFKSAMSGNADLLAFVTTYVYNRAENTFVEADSPVFKAWPYIGKKNAKNLIVGIQARIYKDTPDDTIENDLMDFVHLIEQAVATIPAVDDYNAKITDENIECVPEGATAAEAFIEVEIKPK